MACFNYRQSRLAFLLLACAALRAAGDGGRIAQAVHNLFADGDNPFAWDDDILTRCAILFYNYYYFAASLHSSHHLAICMFDICVWMEFDIFLLHITPLRLDLQWCCRPRRRRRRAAPTATPSCDQARALRPSLLRATPPSPFAPSHSAHPFLQATWPNSWDWESWTRSTSPCR